MRSFLRSSKHQRQKVDTFLIHKATLYHQSWNHGIHGILQTLYAMDEIVVSCDYALAHASEVWNSLSWKINLKDHNRNVQKNPVLNLALVVCFTPSLSSRKNRRRWRQKGTGSASKSPEKTYFLSEQISSSCEYVVSVHWLSAPRKPKSFHKCAKQIKRHFNNVSSVGLPSWDQTNWVSMSWTCIPGIQFFRRSIQAFRNKPMSWKVLNMNVKTFQSLWLQKTLQKNHCGTKHHSIHKTHPQRLWNSGHPWPLCETWFCCIKRWGSNAKNWVLSLSWMFFKSIRSIQSTQQIFHGCESYRVGSFQLNLLKAPSISSKESNAKSCKRS